MSKLNNPISAILLIATFILFFAGTSVAAEAKSAPRLITVTGEAELKVVPDRVVITMAVETNHMDLETAKDTNDGKIKKILSVSGKYGVKPEHVQTGQMSIEPRRIYQNRKEEFIGYFVRKTVVIQLHDLGKFENLLSDLLTAGVNYVHNIQLQTSKINEYKKQAQTLAIRAAKEKAAMLAGELGQKIGKPYSINENQTRWWSGGETGKLYGLGSYKAFQGVPNTTTHLLNDAQATETSIAPGQIMVKANVTVSFEMN